MDGLRIEKKTIRELAALVDSGWLDRLAVLPISSLRAQSYINNPCADPEDTVLYLGYLDEALVAYRSMLVDRLTHGEGATKFAWHSGTWVREDCRRRGYSTMLQQEIERDWANKLCYTNYAPAAKLLMDRTGNYVCWQTLEGQRFYRRFCLAEILPARHTIFQKIKGVLKALDWLLNLFNDLRIQRGRHPEDIRGVTRILSPDSKDLAFIQKCQSNASMRHEPAIWKWIYAYPWADKSAQSEEEQSRYYFTVWREDFQQSIYRFTNEQDEITGLLMLLIKDRKMKITYAFFEVVETEKITSCLKKAMAEGGVDTVTCFDPVLIKILASIRPQFWYHKPQSHKIFMHKKWHSTLNNPQSIPVLYGDGDVVFV
jgi:hypothetical protein